MKAKNNLWAFIIIGILGTLLHFTYDLSGENLIVGLFSPINESIWEHQKLLFYAVIFYSLFEYYLSHNKANNYLPATALGLLAGTLTIVMIFYTYTGIIGYNISFIDIALYYIGVLVFLTVKNIVIKNHFFESKTANSVALLFIVILGVLFAVFTFYPLKIPFFIPKPE